MRYDILPAQFVLENTVPVAVAALGIGKYTLLAVFNTDGSNCFNHVFCFHAVCTDVLHSGCAYFAGDVTQVLHAGDAHVAQLLNQFIKDESVVRLYPHMFIVLVQTTCASH